MKDSTSKLSKPSSSLLQGSDFIILSAPKRQTNTLIFGDGGTGKSTFALKYCPDPIAFINFDGRAEEIIAKVQEEGRKVLYLPIEYPENVTRLTDSDARRIGQAAVDKTIKNFEWSVQQSRRGNIRTIALDTGTEYGEILTLAVRGRLDKGKGDYGESKNLINQEWWRLFRLARSGSAHFVVLSRAKAIWVNNAPTGNFAPKSHDVVFDAVDWAGHIRLKKTPKGKLKKEFELEITKAGINIDELGEVYTENDWSELGGPFVYSCMRQYLGTGPEDW